MNPTKELVRQLGDANLSANQRAQLRCQLARQREEEGDYEAAREAMGELWQRVGERPLVEGLDEETKGEVLLRVGALTGWIGSSKQIDKSQEVAKNLLTESILLFEGLGENEKAAAAHTDLAYCYWREGGFDEARVILQEALTRLALVDNETKAVALLRSAIVERSAKRFHDALRIHTEAAPLFDGISNHLLRAQFHNGFANVLNFLSATEYREDYVDRALIEYAAASFHFEQAGHERYRGCVENNLGFLFSTIGKFGKAHEHLDTAQMIFTSLKDVHLAQVDETRARVMLAEGRLVDAEKASRRAVQTLEKGDELSLLAEALTTHGISQARLQHPKQARATLERAIDVAEQVGDIHSAGLAALTLIEQLDKQLSDDDLCATIERAETLLAGTRDTATLQRLCTCACRVLARVHGYPTRPDWPSFSLKEAIQRYEAHFIEMALKDSGGRVTQAASLLGLPGHQALLFMLDSRHKNLNNARVPMAPRRRSIIDGGKTPGIEGENASKKTRTIKILHVEDDETMARMMKETLTPEGWEVETCADGTDAMGKILSHAEYDLLLLDYELPGMNGIQLVQHARSVAHRRLLPIIILSATLDETAARMAGADALLRKPEDIAAVTETVARLLRSAAA
jgi:CheY-like chemotaxis protein/tetratricopeptide (TPR) repeat protein